MINLYWFYFLTNEFWTVLVYVIRFSFLSIAHLMTCILIKFEVCCYENIHINEHILTWLGAHCKPWPQSITKTEIERSNPVINVLNFCIKYEILTATHIFQNFCFMTKICFKYFRWQIVACLQRLLCTTCILFSQKYCFKVWHDLFCYFY